MPSGKPTVNGRWNGASKCTSVGEYGASSGANTAVEHDQEQQAAADDAERVAQQLPQHLPALAAEVDLGR